jgi:phage shock protein A
MANNETKLDKIIKKLDAISKDISELPKKEEVLKTKSAENPVDFAERANNSKSFAIISERLERVKEKLEAGGLKAREAARLGKEYDKLKNACDQLIDQL